MLDHGASRYQWRDLRQLWRYRDVWLPEIVENHSVIFPVRAASNEVKEFLVERCRSAGVRV